MSKTLFLMPLTGGAEELEEELELLPHPAKNAAAMAAHIIQAQFFRTHFFRRIIDLALRNVGVKA